MATSILAYNDILEEKERRLSILWLDYRPQSHPEIW